MAITGAIALSAAAIGSSAYSANRQKKAMAEMQKNMPQAPEPTQMEPTKDGRTMERDSRRRRTGGRGGTLTTGAAGITNGQSYQGNTLLGG